MNIVLLHGLAGSSRYFASLEHVLANEGHATLSFDLLGFGVNVDKGSEYSLAEQISWITAQVTTAFGDQQVVLLGHSLGGIFALAWAHAHRQQCAAVILLNTHMAHSRGELVADARRRNLSWGHFMLDYPRVSHLACTLLCKHKGMRLFRSWKPPYLSDAVFDDYTAHTWQSVSRMFQQVYLGCPGMPLLAGLETTRILNIFGLRDSAMDRPIQNNNITNIPVDSGHYAYEQQPGVVLTAIRDFLAALEHAK